MSRGNPQVNAIIERWKHCEIPLWKVREELAELIGREEADTVAMRLFAGESPTNPDVFSGFTNGREPRSEGIQIPIVAKRNGLMYFQVTP